MQGISVVKGWGRDDTVTFITYPTVVLLVMSLTDMKRDVVESADGDWMVGADGVIVCPCGHRIEDDGNCPDGHTSPLRSKGLI
jgi:hypothetical protein